MRVALVVAGPYPMLRGSQVLVGQLAAGLGERGHEVHLVTYGSGRHGTAASLVRRTLERPGPSPIRIALDVALVVRLWHIVRRRGIEIIHAHNYEAAIAGLLVGRATRRPLVYHGHSALAEELPLYCATRPTRRLAARLGALLDAHVPRRADFCIAVTEELSAMLRRAGVGEDELACIAPAGAPPDLGPRPVPGPTTGYICYAGNLDGYQNLDFLLETFARVRGPLPDARLMLVTHGDPARAWRKIGVLGPTEGVEVSSARTYDEVRACLAAADVAVCPRTARSGFPMKLLNYMAAGKAIVAAAGSAKGLDDAVTGRVVPDGDSVAFADAIVALLLDAGERRRLGRAARRAVESPHAWEAVLGRVEDIYRRVAGARSPGLVPLAYASRATEGSP